MEITELKPNEVFVFGSNLQGRHGRGAAKTALQWGAVLGEGRGHFGQTYALPTIDWEPEYHFIGWDEVELELTIFIAYARSKPNLTFLLTPIGTGLAGGSLEDLDRVVDGLRFPTNVIFTWRE